VSNESPWDTTSPVASVAQGGGAVTLVEGQTFCLSSRSGDIAPELPHGLFVLDTRVVSRLELRLNGHLTETLAVATPDPFSATFVCRGAPLAGAADASLVLFRHRHIGRGMREQLVLTNHGLDSTAVTIELRCDADFADLFAVKEGRAVPRDRHHEADHQQLRFIGVSTPSARRVQVGLSPPADVQPTVARWTLVLAPRETWRACVEISVTLGDHEIVPRFRCGEPDEETVPSQRLASWRARLPAVSTDCAAFADALKHSGEDLGALRIFDPDHPELPILAAGAPWFMTVFGRDSLITGWMTLPADPSLAHGVLETLARFQGQKIDPITEEEPGKILHEMRFGGAAGLALGGGDVYYGSIDATPLFVMLLGELRRWGLEDELVERLLPHADRALAWIDDYGDRDGDGYVEYGRRNPEGLLNQGWKDSWDAVRFADGTLPSPPIALCEVQGYVYAAYIARAHFAWEAGDAAMCAHYEHKAAELRRRFNEDFWLEEAGTYAMGLDADKRPIDAVTSNVGHCLWTGIVDPARAAMVADRLLAPDMFSGWGVRTLASSMAAYNPVSYHNGSVWPHDNALCAAGLGRYGFTEHAHKIIEGQVAVATSAGGRLPELFAGFARDEMPVPGSYPASCSPQAWAAASPLLWLRTLLRLDPWVTHGKVFVAPAMPAWMQRMLVDGIRLGEHRLTITVDHDQVSVVDGGGHDLIRVPRAPLTASHANSPDG
jgi:glycogen debranching enzyme